MYLLQLQAQHRPELLEGKGINLYHLGILGHFKNKSNYPAIIRQREPGPLFFSQIFSSGTKWANNIIWRIFALPLMFPQAFLFNKD